MPWSKIPFPFICMVKCQRMSSISLTVCLSINIMCYVIKPSSCLNNRKLQIGNPHWMYKSNFQALQNTLSVLLAQKWGRDFGWGQEWAAGRRWEPRPLLAQKHLLQQQIHFRKFLLSPHCPADISIPNEPFLWAHFKGRCSDLCWWAENYKNVCCLFLFFFKCTFQISLQSVLERPHV